MMGHTMRAPPWLLPVAWMAVIFLLSFDAASSEHTSRLLLPLFRRAWPSASDLQLQALHALTRKAAHVTEYGVLAALWVRALARAGWPAGAAARGALGISLAWAVIDETHQALVASRTSSPADVLLDATGALAAVLVARAGWRAAADRLTAALLWAAAVGGALVLALDAALDVPAGLLWLTAPAAALLLALRRWARRRG